MIASDLYVGGPAQSAGLRPGDQIVAIDGKAVESIAKLVDLIGSRAVTRALT